MAQPIVGEPTLSEIVDIWLGDDGEVTPSRWYHRLLRVWTSAEWMDKRYHIREWWTARFDSDVSNDAH